MIRAGIIGGAGYTGGELIRLLMNHPMVNLAFIQSNSQAGKKLSAVHRDLFGETELVFTKEEDYAVDVLFLCNGHGQAKLFLEAHSIPEETVVIDLSTDFRLHSDWIYGLPELHKSAIASHNRIANCGCFATAIHLALLPLAAHQALPDDIVINAITGATGAGQQPGPTTHFSWRNNNLSTYKPFTHQHLAEITANLNVLQPISQESIHFIPLRGDFPRGIFTTSLMTLAESEQTLYEWYEDFYQKAKFTHVTPENPDLKQVTNTNKAIVHIKKAGHKLMVISMIDNLLKGASGQAVQNMNIRFGFPEDAGLKLKAVVY
jgi:N-acetyl-gamma-glutamyl-phosphate reductase